MSIATPDIIVVGAGIGGLSAAIALASRGRSVRIFEAADGPGGKIGVATSDGVEFDTGPSLLTLPSIFGELFERAGTRLEDEVELVEHDRAFRYLWPDGAGLDVYGDPEATRESVYGALGAAHAAEFDDFLAYARRIWEAAAPNFVLGEAPSLGSMLRLGIGRLGELMAIDPLNTMAEAIDARVDSPKLRDVLYRYATYNGSNPFRAPATLNCIAWVELGLGGYGVRGGMYELVRAMERIAKRLGVEITYGAPVRRIDTAGGAVEAVVTDQKRHRCQAVVVNADVAHLVDELLGEASSAKIAAPAEPSMSGWTAVARAERRPEEARAPHTVYFPERYGEEFVDIFERRRPPEEPTVYLCAQEKAHDRTGWEREEPLFLMVNAPCEPAEMPRAERAWSELRNRALGRLYEAGLIEKSDAIVWERTPTELAERFPGSRGSIYGAASNSKTAAFKRPPNRVEGVEGLYLASGSAHPGGGVPLCAQSGRLAAKAVASDLA